MLKCPNCSRSWIECGNQWVRDNGKVDYRCGNCGAKRKPITVEPGESVLNENGFACGGVITNAMPRGVYDFMGVGGESLQSVRDEYKKIQVAAANLHKGTSSFIHPTSSPINILVVGDLHLPFTLAGYLSFCKSIYDKYNCDHVIFIGDLIDNHVSSFHATDPDGMGGGDELDLAIKNIQEWAKVFPVADVCIGNHDALALRKAFKEGVSKRWIKDFHEVLGVDWVFKPSFEYNNCLFRHGMNMKAAPKSGSEMMNVIQGHFHTSAYVHWNVGRGKKVFGMQVGCGVCRESYAMAYAKESPKQAIGCGVVLENGRLPIVELMDL